MLLKNINHNSALVIAHPDDEILWFSSVLEKVDKVIFCYCDCPSNPQLGINRRKVLANYPLSNVICLYINESEVFGKTDWRKPEIGECGLMLDFKDDSFQVYNDNFHLLRKTLGDTLKGYQQIITHNPWGEYGNEEHVQVFRAVHSLQSELGFDIWFSNYFSNKSFNLLSKYLNRLDKESIKNPINKNIAMSIKAIYTQNNCWTWYENWEWEKMEALIREVPAETKTESFGYNLPLNMIKVRYPKGKRSQKAKLFDFLKSIHHRTLFKKKL